MLDTPRRMEDINKGKQRTRGQFDFQQFSIRQDRCAMKVGTDGVLLGAWVPVEGAKSMLDIGAGTGLISLMLAQRSQEAKVTAVEVDEDAASQAIENAAASPFASQIVVEQQSIQDFSRQHVGPFDLIVSNPPFFSGGVISEQEGRASVRHTVKLSHQDLLRSVQKLLTKEGSFCLILPWLEGLRFQELAASYQLNTHRVVKVSPNPEKSPNRLLLQLKKSPTPEQGPEMSELSIYAYAGPDAPRSAEYAALTAYFFL